MTLTHFESKNFFTPPEHTKKPRGFMIFSGGTEREHWPRMS